MQRPFTYVGKSLRLGLYRDYERFCFSRRRLYPTRVQLRYSLMIIVISLNLLRSRWGGICLMTEDGLTADCWTLPVLISILTITVRYSTQEVTAITNWHLLIQLLDESCAWHLTAVLSSCCSFRSLEPGFWGARYDATLFRGQITRVNVCQWLFVNGWLAAALFGEFYGFAVYPLVGHLFNILDCRQFLIILLLF